MQLSKIDSGDPELDGLIAKWLEWNPKGTKDHQVISDLVDKADFGKLKKMMKPRNSFGTAGIRGVMAPG